MGKEWEYDYECCEFVSPTGERLPLRGLGEFVARLNAMQAVVDAAKEHMQLIESDIDHNEYRHPMTEIERKLRTALTKLKEAENA